MAARRPLLLIVVPLVLAACGGGGGGSASSQNADRLPAAVQKSLAQGSEKVTLNGKVDLSGQKLTLDGDGAFGAKGGELHLNVTVPVIGKTTVDEVVVGRRSWIRSPLAGKDWVRADGNAKALGFDVRTLTGVTPATALRLLHSGKVTAVSDDHYSVAVDRTINGVRFNSAEAWLDDRNLVEKVKLDFDANLAGNGNAHTVLTIDYSDYGTPVAVAPPAE